jgi:NitT/TauT family transport system permease protein
VAVALVFAQSRIIEASLLPYAILLQVTPIVAIAPLIIIWVKDTTSRSCSARSWWRSSRSSRARPSAAQRRPGLADLFRMSRASRCRRSCACASRARCRISSRAAVASGLALIGAVVAEFVAGTGGQGAGLAYQILMAGIQLNVPRLFAALVLITLAGSLVPHGGAAGATVLSLGTRSELRRNSDRTNGFSSSAQSGHNS